MILRHVLRLRRPYLRPPRNQLSTEAPIPTHSPNIRKNPNDIKPFPLSSSLSLISSPNAKSVPLVLVSGTLMLTLAVAVVIYKDDLSHPKSSDRFYAELEETLEKSKNSLRRVFVQMSQTAAAAAVLWKSLASVMSSANQEMRSGFEFRVAALLADIAAASGVRRSAIVGASGGAVVDWLLETVGTSGMDRSGTREEAARALAYLIADPGVCESVLGRPRAVPNLLKFIFWFQPKGGQKYKNSSLDSPGLCKGRSMLVTALMDIVTSNCDTIDFSSFHPLLPGKADMRDVAAALEVVEEGGIHLDDQQGEKDDGDGDKGMKGIGIKVLGGTTILGFSRTNDLLESDDGHLQLTSYITRNMALRETSNKFLEPEKASITIPGLWDDLQREHVAVPFAAWALANWALASEINRSHIQELDRDGHAIMTALTARERTVKWHGSLVARALLDDQNLPLTFSVPSWSSSLLSTAFHASKVGDISLAQVALSAFVVSVERSDDAKKAVMGKGLHIMREITKQAERHRNLQELLARVLELLYAGNMHLSVEEAQRWSGTLLRWIFGASASDSLRFSATKILSSILEDYGPASIPISQGWLTICLNEIIEASKTSTLKGSTPLKTNKTQIDQSNALSAAQVVNQLATAVIKLASNQLESESDLVDKFSFSDLLSLEPFAPLFRSMKETNMSKFDAADSALATLKSVKALSELCSEDVACQNKLADFGILCLLRRLLLSDDYENLAAIEAYDASRALEMQDRGSAASSDSSSVNSNDPSSVRVPPTAHIRRHTARLLRILSLLPKVKKAIIEDKDWCKWLEDCASGRVPCCNDLKTQSNARATLLNIFCSNLADIELISTNPGMEGGSQKTKCAQYQDMIFLINPELPHWKCPEKNNLVMSQDSDVTKRSASSVCSSPSDSSGSIINENSDTSRFIDTLDSSDSPLLDIIFIHGLRGGPFKSWRIADNKSSTTSKAGLVENIDQEAGREGTCWPREWLSADFPYARLLTVKYKTNLTQWSGASLPLQEVSSMLLQKLVAAGIGDRPVVFITHSMGGLVVKQMLYQAKISNFNNFVNNTIGVVFYSCPHFGSKLADMPWRMGMVFRPAPTIGELRSGSPRLVELNDFIRLLHKKGHLEVLSFSETQVTPIVEGYGGWAFRMEIVPIESAYPGFGELVVLDGTDHINSCKPVNRTDPSYSETLEFLKKLRACLA